MAPDMQEDCVLMTYAYVFFCICVQTEPGKDVSIE